MLIKSRFLGDAGWKDLAARNKLKDNGLTKTLERLRRVDDRDHDDQAKSCGTAFGCVALL